MGIQEDNAKQVRQLILEKSAIIFSENDYVRVRMQDIAQAVGISRGPLYYYYKNKEELFEATIKYLIEEQRRGYDKVLSKKAPIKEILREEYLQCLSFSNSILQTMKNQPELQGMKEYQDFRYWLYNKKKEVFTQAKERGELKENADPNKLVTFLYVFYTGVIHIREDAYTGFDVYDTDLLENSIDMYIKIVESLFLE